MKVFMQILLDFILVFVYRKNSFTSEFHKFEFSFLTF